MRWNRLGRVYCPTGEHSWMLTHAANPVAELRDDGTVRVYFGARDDSGRTSIGYVDLEIADSFQVLAVNPFPVVAPGSAGAFDDSGASMGCLVRTSEARFLYYLGWNLSVTVPWRNSIGLARSPVGESRFERVSLAPVLDRNRFDPYSLSYPWVLHDEGRWRMWYGSNLSWGTRPTDMKHVIRYAESEDGIVWRPTGETAIVPGGGGEFAVARPCVVRDKSCWRMWFSARANAYRIGYAESTDGIHWVRMDEKYGLEPSFADWENEAVSYASVFDHGGRRYMLYNGNSYGRTGFGIAVLDEV
jgi:hypothetical protein